MKYNLILHIAGSVSAVMLCGCRAEPTTTHASAGPAPMPVQVRTVDTKQVPDFSVVVATIKSRASAAINPEVEGQVTAIFVTAGDHVRAGSVVLQIDSLRQQAVVSAQEQQHTAQTANVKFAKQQMERTRYLADAGVVSKQELEQAQATYDAAQALLESIAAQVREQREQLRQYRVTAPTDGIVGDIPVRVGDRVSRSTLLTTVSKPEDLEAYIPVPVERASELRHGLGVEFLDEAGSVITHSRIHFIAPEVSGETQTVLAKAPVTSRAAKFRTSEYVRTRILWGTADRATVPVLSVSRINGEPFVFVAKPAPDSQGAFIAQQIAVRLGDTVGNDYAVLDGVRPGDRLIVSGTQMLANGAPVAPNTK